ncbi:type I restriction-modification system subunit M [Mesoplasma tabanidae]|uniref:site-specific DNA-methyltransferase (adenine-specific) n=1 Tax=Mesoplasma tabanidae TaxID=219745 RepID=A0A2K8P4V8_9MOLU|nr:class I SAM-dependent DNA methyltransferase [Mesoplasma tabanidae]ATZ21518.1 type I restriction enzyme M protein [Mesoplasma tabanidae]
MAKNIKEIESKLWEAANVMRGNTSAEEYMHTILGILTLKYISDRNVLALQTIANEGMTPEMFTQEELYYSYKTFVVHEESTWEYIMKFANSEKIGERLDNAFVKLESDNEILRGIFNKNFNDEGIDQIKLGDVIKIFSDEDLSEDDNEDIIGRVYEYFLGKFFKDRGQKGGEFYTPTSIVKLMVNLIKPVKGTIYDPACGTGGILVQAKRYIQEHDGKIEDITVYGQEYNIVTWKLAKLNLVLNGFSLFDTDNNGVLGQTNADTFTNDQHKNKKFDFVMANPPFNMKNWGFDSLQEDSRFKWGMPPSGNANYSWLSHMLSKLSVQGKMAIVLANGSLSSSQKQERLIRENFVKENKVDAIIELPDKLFYTTGIPACIWIFNNQKINENILMVAGSNIEGNMISKKLRELTENDILNIEDVYNNHLKGQEVNVQGFAKTITIDELIENDYSFVPGRYVESKEEVIDKKAVKADIEKLSSEVFELLKEFEDLSPKLEEALKKALESE